MKLKYDDCILLKGTIIEFDEENSSYGGKLHILPDGLVLCKSNLVRIQEYHLMDKRRRIHGDAKLKVGSKVRFEGIVVEILESLINEPKVKVCTILTHEGMGNDDFYVFPIKLLKKIKRQPIYHWNTWSKKYAWNKKYIL